MFERASPKIFSKLGKPYFRTIGPLIVLLRRFAPGQVENARRPPGVDGPRISSLFEQRRTARSRGLGLAFGEGRVEEAAGGGEAHLLLDEAGGLGGAVLAVHAGVFPLDRERAVVADLVEGAGDGVEVDLAAARRAEVPAAAGVAEVQVRAEDAGLAVERPRGVLDVDVVDPVGERPDELRPGRRTARAGGWGRS